MHYHPFPHQHVNFGALQMAVGVIVVPAVFLALLFWIAHMV